MTKESIRRLLHSDSIDFAFITPDVYSSYFLILLILSNLCCFCYAVLFVVFLRTFLPNWT